MEYIDWLNMREDGRWSCGFPVSGLTSAPTGNIHQSTDFNLNSFAHFSVRDSGPSSPVFELSKTNQYIWQFDQLSAVDLRCIKPYYSNTIAF
ncbi:hypothetical protein AFUB_073180 [Aspergillus fumigatus A1163]|uniref:Uncharacterized protein n=1 Tax=Aspergillus fumigatus (strain CBS 144.89 / FGSC A1163 / CEA10) TaxID=451804 RepID=B0Y7B0_ASPFC|nr:hypothetical protein AFUB_073180 [Aspergillus fumigatus A1163]